MEKDSMSGLERLHHLVNEGPATVRTLLDAGQVDLALAQALWLRSARHPQAARLVAEAERAVRARSSTPALP